VTALGLALAAGIGLSLGLLGGGGSILTVPVLVYVLGYEAKEAIALSLGVVGATSAAGAVSHWRAGNVDVAVALVFGGVAMGGTYLGARLSVFFSGGAQLLLFAAVMLAAAYFMGRGGARPAPAGERREGGDGSSGSGADLNVPVIVAEGLAVGVLTGLVGVGGGFLIVPALVLVGGLGMKKAVGTSLLVIALKSGAGFYGYLDQVTVPWGFLGAFTAVSIVGIVIGSQLVRFVSQGALRRGFAAFLVVMGLFIVYQNRDALLPGSDAPRAAVESAESVESVDPGGTETDGDAGREREERE
jgi:uncharacterized membrane protein YfcA